MSLTIAYITARKRNEIQWFFDSLRRQLEPNENVEIIVIDHYYDEDRNQRFLNQVPFQESHFAENENQVTRHERRLTHCLPKPNVWSGPHRLTNTDWFSAANSRNTALCLTRTTHLAYVDDVSVLAPTWLQAVKDAMAGGYIGCGAYQKVKDLTVENGEIKSFTEFPEGKDHRLDMVHEDVAPCNGNWMFGCSLLFPVEDLLEVGGWPELCDGAGAEDTTLGIVLRNAGKHLKFCKRMMTYESEELHHYTVGSDHSWEEGKRVSGNMIRRDKGDIGTPQSKSHAIVRLARQSTYFENYYKGGMRALREHMLNGGEWPTAQVPQHDWYDSQPIAEME